MEQLACAFCRNFEGEARAALAGTSDVALAFFPARCGRPPLAPRELRETVGDAAGPVEVFGAACCSGLGAAELPDRWRVVALASCFELVAPRALVESRLREGAYVITPGWLRCWPERLAEAGFGEPELARRFFGECAAKLLLLDTGVDPDARRRLDELADHLALRAEVLPVGVELLRERLLRRRAEAVLESERSGHTTALASAHRQSAEYAAAVDLVGTLTELREERDVVERTLDVCFALFAPERVAYLPSPGAGPGELEVRPPLEDAAERIALAGRLSRGDDPPRGFAVRVEHHGTLVGMLSVEGVAFPRFRERYLDLVSTVARVCGLAIANARAFQEVRRAQGSARDAVEARDRFLSIASHELRTPLTSLLLQGQVTARRVAAGEPFSPEQVARLSSGVVRQAGRLQRLVDDMLDVSRIAAGKLELRLSTVDLAALVASELELHEEALRARGYVVSARLEPGLVGRWDPQRLAQVVANLLTNAIRYGDGKPLEIVLSRHGGTARLAVRDQGPGIAPEDQARIFRAFERATPAVRETGGLGLGLFIAAQIVAALGGSVAVESAPGAGSTFTVELPLEAPAA